MPHLFTPLRSLCRVPQLVSAKGGRVVASRHLFFCRAVFGAAAFCCSFPLFDLSQSFVCVGAGHRRQKQTPSPVPVLNGTIRTVQKLVPETVRLVG